MVGIRNCVCMDVLFNSGIKLVKVVIEVSKIVCKCLVYVLIIDFIWLFCFFFFNLL